MTKAEDVLVEKLEGLAPELAIVLGSGLGPMAAEVEDAVRIPYGELPGFPRSGVTGHAGEVVLTTMSTATLPSCARFSRRLPASASAS